MRNRISLKTGLVIAALAALVGCKEPPVPPEVQLAFSQEQELWRAGAPVYAHDDYLAYQAVLEQARNRLNGERARMVWFRDYPAVGAQFREVLNQGERLRAEIAATRSAEQSAARDRLEGLQRVLLLLRELAEDIKDSRLSGRRLARAELDLEGARRYLDAGQIRLAPSCLDRAEQNIREQVRLVLPLVARFADPSQLQRWQRMVSDSLQESRQQGRLVLVVSKLEGELRLYRGGKEIRRFPVGFGFNMLSDKLYAGDKATPEGRYRVIRKNPHSRYGQALLLDYPNAEDRQRYREARRKGLIPRNSGAGSLIEIHGGGRKGLTNGCIALENAEMDQLFELVPTGTSVTIVGSLRQDNPLAIALRGLK